MGDQERVMVSVGGAALLYRGLKRGDWLGMAAAAAGSGLLYMGVTGNNPLARAAGIRVVETRHGGRRIEVVKSMTINRPAAELFAFWRDFRNLPQIMPHLRSVDVLSEKRSHWVAQAPAGFTVEWDAEIVNEKPATLIAWQSLEGSGVANWGVVRFTEISGGRGTEVRVELEYESPAGTAGVALAKLFGEEPSQQVEDGLRRFKHITEAGEVPTIEGQPRGNGQQSVWTNRPSGGLREGVLPFHSIHT
jgi:uncharacterized membrane protein